MMIFLRSIFFFLLVFNIEIFATEIVYLPEPSIALRKLDIPISEKQYIQFDNAKREYYKNVFNQIGAIDQELALFELHDPNTGNISFVLGTVHNIPYECLPFGLASFIEREVDEVYLESEFVTLCQSMITVSQQRWSPESDTFEKVAVLLNPLIQIFSKFKTISDISIENIFALLMSYDAMLGMDSSISMLARKLEKPVSLLDAQMDLIKTDLNLYKASIKRTIETFEQDTSTVLEEALLEMGDQGLMYSFVKKEANYLCQLPNESYFIPNLAEDINKYLEDLNRIEDPLYLDEIRKEVNYGISQTEERNLRWCNLISSAPTTSRRLICVGINHLPDLFDKFKKAGLKIVKRFIP